MMSTTPQPAAHYWIATALDSPGVARKAVARALDAGFTHVVFGLPSPYPDNVGQWVADELIAGGN
jgi:hypothetical protein